MKGKMVFALRLHKLDNFHFAHAFSVNQFDWIKSNLSYNVAKITKYHIIRTNYLRYCTRHITKQFARSNRARCKTSIKFNVNSVPERIEFMKVPLENRYQIHAMNNAEKSTLCVSHLTCDGE